MTALRIENIENKIGRSVNSPKRERMTGSSQIVRYAVSIPD